MAGTYIYNTQTFGLALYGTPQNPVTIGSAGYLTNAGTNHGGDAIYGSSVTAWSIGNFGTIKSVAASSSAIELTVGGTVGNDAATATIAGALFGVLVDTGTGTVTNSGTISANGVYGTGIYFGGGGTVTNAAGAMISGVHGGVIMTGNVAGNIRNLGTITAAGPADYVFGVYINTGVVTNGTSGAASALISSTQKGIVVGGAGGSVSNFGTVKATGSSGIGIYLRSGGSVTNAQGASISGMSDGVVMNGAGTVSNSGTISGLGTAGYVDGVYMTGGTVVNGPSGVTSALISGVKYAVVMAGSAFSSVSNFGTISASGGAGAGGYPLGVYIKGDGRITNGATNAATAVISAANYAIKIAGSAVGTIVNFGTIRTTLAENPATQVYPDGIYWNGSGVVVNGATNAHAALIAGGHRGVYIGGTLATTVSNFGTIEGLGTKGAGIFLATGAGAAIIGNSGTVTGSGTEGDGIDLYAGGAGVSNAAGALISGQAHGIFVSGDSAVDNSGTISAPGAAGIGVLLAPSAGGAALNNRLGAVIRGGYRGISIYGAGTIDNAGTVLSGTNGVGIYLASGNVTNFGTIVAPGTAGKAVVVRSGTFFNSGVVTGSVYGIQLGATGSASGSGRVTVAGTISGLVGIGAVAGITAGYTITVGGAVIGSGGTAISLTPHADNRLILQPGVALTGVVDGGAGSSSLLEIAAPGGGAGALGRAFTYGTVIVSLDLGNVTDFTTLQVDTGETLVVTGGVGGGAAAFAVARIGGVGSGGATIVDLNSHTLNAAEIDFGVSQAEVLMAGGAVTSSVLKFYQTAGNLLSGSGLLNMAGGTISGPGMLSANGGTLDVSGTIVSGVGLAVAGGTLKLEAVANAAAAIAFNAGAGAAGSGAATATDTLEIGALGAVTIGVMQTIGAGDAVQLDGGSLTDAFGLTLAGGMLSGFGSVNASVTATTTATITAAGGTLQVTGALADPAAALSLVVTGPFDTLLLDTGGAAQSVGFTAGAGTVELGPGAALTVAAAVAPGGGTFMVDADSLLILNGAVGSGNTVAFGAATGALALVDDTGFAGTISGLAVGAGGEFVDIIGKAVTITGRTGQGTTSGTLTLSDGAVLNLADLPASGWKPMTADDGHGGTAIFLSALAPLAASDLNGDVRSDIVWSNPNTGDTWVWLMNGSQVSGNNEIAAGGGGYRIIATGDFNGDRKSDILWTNPNTGDTWVWTMNGSQITSNAQVGAGGGGYKIIAAGDFDGDGKSDILWTNPSSGDTWIWTMNGAQVVANNQVGIAGAGYRIFGAGDFNGDGKADILWCNPATNDTWIWEMNGAQIVANLQVGAGGGGYQIAGVGDFNGDGKADILWQNPNSGDTWVWLMNGGQLAQNLQVGAGGAGYRIVGVGDYNGDGKSDILWENPNTGDTWIWQMNGSQIVSNAEVGAGGGGYQIVGAGAPAPTGAAALFLPPGGAGAMAAPVLPFIGPSG